MAFGRWGRRSKTGGGRGTNQYGVKGVSKQDQEAAAREAEHATVAAQSASTGAQALAADIVETPVAVVDPMQEREDARKNREAAHRDNLARIKNTDSLERHLQGSQRIQQGVEAEELSVAQSAQQAFGGNVSVKLDPTTFDYEYEDYSYISGAEEFHTISVKGTATVGDESGITVLEVESKSIDAEYSEPGLDERKNFRELEFFHVGSDGTRTPVTSRDDIKRLNSNKAPA